MVCPRCGTVFEGNFCPRCGAPAPRPVPVTAAPGAVCPRCGMVFQGNFCPRCGLAVGMAAYPMPLRPGPSSGTRSALSVLWILIMVGFFLFIATNIAGLLLSPAYIVPGIQGIGSGQDVNPGFTAGTAGWTFEALNGSATTSTYVPGGPSGGYVQMTLPAGNAGGAWVQAVPVHGSPPFAGEVRLDIQVVTSPPSQPITGALVVALEPSPTGIDMAHAAVLWVNGSTSWTTTPDLDVSAALANPGTYYLKVAYIALSNGGNTQVSFDNVHLGWATDAVFYFYLPLPLPLLLYISQEPGPFLAYYGFIVAAILASAVWYTWRDRRLTAQAFTAPLDAIGSRLRSMSGWVAVAQVWLATTFFQVALIYVLLFSGFAPSSPFTPTPQNTWTLLFDYSAASVFEEIAFRAFLIGLPMAVGALVWRLARARGPRPPGAPKESVVGALRYLWGGQLRKESSKEALLVGGILVLVSSLLFGLAHAPGWGWWKVLPAFVAGLGMGYVYVRHGLGASILLHFATDGSLALSLEGVGGDALALVTDLMFLALAVAGIGFLAWYLMYGWREFDDLRRRFGSRGVRPPAAASGAAVPPPGWSYAPPPTWPQAPSYPYGVAPPPPPPPGYAPPSASGWPTVPTAAAPRSAAQVPQGYAPTYHPAPYGYPPVRFQCPYCGWVEAKYEARRFTCLRCGRTA